MDPISVSAAVGVILKALDWNKIGHKLLEDGVTDAGKFGEKRLLRWFQADEREKAARRAIELFTEEFLRELADKQDLSAALPEFQKQLKKLIEYSAADIAGWLGPDTKEVNLGPVETMWKGLGLSSLGDFDWTLVAKSYARQIRGLVRQDGELREQLAVAQREQMIAEQQQANATLARMAGPDAGFDVAGYRDYLRKKCGMLALSAMHSSAYDRRIKLWSVFVAQTARESAPVKDIPREILRQLREEGQVQAEHDDEMMARLREQFQSSPVGPVLEVLERNRLVVVVLGDPGSGKTSLLKYLAMRWVNGEAATLPLWVDLKEYAQESDGLLKFIASGAGVFKFDASKLQERLQAGDAVLYLDGLDEVFDGPTRGRVIEEVFAFAAQFAKARVVVTSRSFGYEPEKLRDAGFAHATLEDFDDAQVTEFLQKWHAVAEEDAKERGRLLGRLEKALQDSRAVRELAGNPLLLTMMAILNNTQELPRNRVQLYSRAAEVLLHEWDTRKSLPADKFAWQEKEALLRELAGTMQRGETGLAGNLIERTQLLALFRSFLKDLGLPDFYHKASELVQQLTERNFILCFAGAERFSFVHRTFLEYFCASWFVERFQVKQTLTLEELKQDVFGAHWRDEKWHEVLRLIAGMVGEKQAEELILYLMEQNGADYRLANMLLAAGCLSEVRNRKAIEGTDRELRRRFVEEVIRFDPPYYFEPWQEYEECGETRTRAMGLTAYAWRSHETGRWLKRMALTDHDWIIRSAAATELARGWKQDPETVGLLKDRARSDENYAVRMAAVQELARGWKQDPETVGWLKDRARSDENYDVRRAAVQELARGWKQDPETVGLIKVLASSDASEYVRRAAVQELARGWKQDPETVGWLKDRARSDENYAVRRAAVQELARGWKQDPETVGLIKVLASSDASEYVRMAAVQELARGWKQDPETVGLIKVLASSDASEYVRRAAVQELARGWKQDPETVGWLKTLATSDASARVREEVVELLEKGWPDDPGVQEIVQAWREERAGKAE